MGILHLPILLTYISQFVIGHFPTPKTLKLLCCHKKCLGSLFVYHRNVILTNVNFFVIFCKVCDAMFGVYPADFQLCFGPEFPYYAPFPLFQNSEVCPVEVCNLFLFWFYRWLQFRAFMNLRRDFGLLTIVEIGIDYGDFWSLLTLEMCFWPMRSNSCHFFITSRLL